MVLSYLVFLLALGTLPQSPHALTNISIDDINTTAINYYPQSSWLPVNSSAAYDGSYQYCNDPTATVTFSFVGIAVYFISSLWPYDLSMSAAIDNVSVGVINVTDPSAPFLFHGPPTGPSHIAWSYTGLPNAPHVLFLDNPVTSNDYHNMNIDGFMYTAEDIGDPPPSTSPIGPPSTSSSSTTSQRTSSAASSPSSSGVSSTNPMHRGTSSALAIGLGVALGSLALLLLALLGYLYLRRRPKFTDRPVIDPTLNETTQNHPSIGGHLEAHGYTVTPFVQPQSQGRSPILSKETYGFGHGDVGTSHHGRSTSVGSQQETGSPASVDGARTNYTQPPEYEA